MKKKIVLTALALVALYLAIAIYYLPVTGIVWDETRHVSGGKARAYSIYSALTGAPQLEICSLETLPPEGDIGRCWDGRPRFFQTIGGLSWATAFFLTDGNLNLMQSMAAHRIVTILLTALGILVVFLFSYELFGLKAGIFSSLALIFIPRFLAHSRYACLDMPVSIMIVLTIYVFRKGIRNWRLGLLSGVVFGLALASKVNAYFVIPVIIPWLLIAYRDRIIPIFRDIRKRAFSIKRIPVAFYSMILLPVPVLILCWPWLWPDPIGRLMSYAAEYTVEGIGAAVYYMGQVFSFDTIHAPWHYTWVITAITVPVFILIFAVLGGLISIRHTISLRNRSSLLVLLGALVPLLMFTIPISPKISPYTGVRLFLWAFPFMAMLAGLGASALADFIKSRWTWPKRAFQPLTANKDNRILGSKTAKLTKQSLHRISRQWLVPIVLVILIVTPGAISVLKGPTNSATYYNSIIGGAGAALQAGFEVEYWGESYFDAAMWLNENAKSNAVIHPALAKNIFDYYENGDIGEIVKRASEGAHGLNTGILERFNISQGGILREDISVSNTSKGSDYYILMICMDDLVAKNESARDIEMKRYFLECEPIYTVYSDGAPLTSIYETGCYETNMLG